MKKISILALGATLLLIGCEKEDDTLIFKELYYEKNSAPVVEINGKSLTAEELRKQTFDNHVVKEVNAFLLRTTIMEKYNITEAFLEKKFSEMNKGNISKEQALEILVLEEASKRIQIPSEQLPKIYKEQYQMSGKSFEELREYIHKTEAMNQIRREAKESLAQNKYIQYINDDLKKSVKEQNEADIHASN